MQLSLDQQVAFLTGARSDIGADVSKEEGIEGLFAQTLDASDYIVGTTLFIDGGMSLYPEFRGNG